MPLGNGDIGLNAWAHADGSIHLLISKTDAWDDNSRLVKVGEALRAQAVAARTYVLYHELDRASAEWDVTSTVAAAGSTAGFSGPCTVTRKLWPTNWSSSM